MANKHEYDVWSGRADEIKRESKKSVFDFLCPEKLHMAVVLKVHMHIKFIWFAGCLSTTLQCSEQTNFQISVNEFMLTNFSWFY